MSEVFSIHSCGKTSLKLEGVGQLAQAVLVGIHFSKSLQIESKSSNKAVLDRPDRLGKRQRPVAEGLS